MLMVLGVLAFVWVCLIIAICAVCAVAGVADEQSEEWYHEHKRMAEDVDQQGRGAA
jgi:Na+-transporting methylmalonyl-CoA/oxaloacetate decarboxylase gamma subunit